MFHTEPFWQIKRDKHQTHNPSEAFWIRFNKSRSVTSTTGDRPIRLPGYCILLKGQEIPHAKWVIKLASATEMLTKARMLLTLLDRLHPGLCPKLRAVPAMTSNVGPGHNMARCVCLYGTLCLALQSREGKNIKWWLVAESRRSNSI